MGNYYSYYFSDSSFSSPPTYSSPPQNPKYGWKRQTPDRRDKRAWLPTPKFTPVVDLVPKCPPVYNQGDLGSCTANAIAFAYEFDEINQEKIDEVFIPSRLFIYYNEREMEGNVSTDSGASLRNGIKSINKIGVCPSALWPYDIENFSEKPTQNCYEDAKCHRAVHYVAVPQRLDQIRSCLQVWERPIVFGFMVYESFESEEVAKSGVMSMPKPEEKILGGHAVAIVGYDDYREMVKVRNSWGENWGDKGHFWMPYKFLLDPEKCGDFWVIRTVRDSNCKRKDK